MTRYEYDEEASQRWHMDVGHEIDERPTPVARWVDAMRRLNSIDDPLARRILTLHRDCGSGSGSCDSGSEDEPIARRIGWGCETKSAIAHHFGVDYPVAPIASD
ncbi:hypothetical protein [uncultured Nocardioides sp.]|uniref:hypothetical protein n=1 Tax=uncultured Nocardioides sp. TaxID=198441 RepID=UPI002627B82D|nr:hypothetical protein [uncultured Nocardioides sp.]